MSSHDFFFLASRGTNQYITHLESDVEGTMNNKNY